MSPHVWRVSLLALVTLRLSTCLCPPACLCSDEEHVVVTCINSSLEIVPMTLNPELQILTLQQNQISQIGSASFQFHPELLRVDLSNNGLKTVQDSTWVHNSRLASLDLSHNNLASTPDLLGLESLQTLDLSHNSLTSITGYECEAAPRLASLRLHHNNISEVTGLHTLDSVTSIDLSHNLLEAVPSLPSSLQRLDLSHNLVMEVYFPRGQSKLQHLDLSHNPLDSLEVESFSRLTHLHSLRLVSTQLTSIPSPALSSLTSLRSLDLSGLLVTSLGQDNLALPALTSLSLTHCPKLEKIETGVFDEIIHLETLNLSHNPDLRLVTPESLSGQGQLSVLDLSQTRLSSLSLPGLASLASLLVEDNPWACDCRLVSLQSLLRSLNPTSGAVCESPRSRRGELVTRVRLEPCDPSLSQLEAGEEEGQMFYLCLFISLTCLSIIGLILIFTRRKLAQIISQWRRGHGPEAQEKFHEELGAEKSFIQYDEYFLSLARYQAELENNPNIPVTEL